MVLLGGDIRLLTLDSESKPKMPRINRNDPCPCGSGKKYKNCCMRRDSFSASRELSLSQAEAYLMNRLYEAAQTPRFFRDLTNAYNLYWGGLYDVEAAQQIPPDDVRRMLEWFIHDYPTGDDRKPLIEWFMETQAVNYPAEALEILRAWATSVSGLFRVLAIGESGQLELYDCLRQGTLSVQDEALARNAKPGDLLIGRLFELRGVKRLSYMTMILPGAFERDLVAYVTNAYNRYMADHYRGTWDTFLRENGHIFMAFLLSPQAEPLRAQIGPGTPYADPARARDKLRELTLRRERERLREEEEEEEEGLLPAEHRTASGIIVPGMPLDEPAPRNKEDQAPSKPTILIPGRDV